MPISLDQFVRRIAGSSLMTADEVAALIDSLPADKKPQDADQLTRGLVRQKKLTAYQAKEIYASRSRSLVLGNNVILDKMGQVGMGLVLKAEHRRMERLVAWKTFRLRSCGRTRVVAEVPARGQSSSPPDAPEQLPFLLWRVLESHATMICQIGISCSLGLQALRCVDS